MHRVRAKDIYKKGVNECRELLGPLGSQLQNNLGTLLTGFGFGRIQNNLGTLLIGFGFGRRRDIPTTHPWVFNEIREDNKEGGGVQNKLGTIVWVWFLAEDAVSSNL